MGNFVWPVNGAVRVATSPQQPLCQRVGWLWKWAWPVVPTLTVSWSLHRRLPSRLEAVWKPVWASRRGLLSAVDPCPRAGRGLLSAADPRSPRLALPFSVIALSPLAHNLKNRPPFRLRFTLLDGASAPARCSPRTPGLVLPEFKVRHNYVTGCFPAAL